MGPVGKRAGHGAYVTWVATGRDQGAGRRGPGVGDRAHRRADKADWAQTVAQYGWKAGSRHPEVAAAHATALARPGRPDDLQAAIDIIDEALATRDGSTAPAWHHLSALLAQLAGLQRRAEGRPTSESDEDGNPVIDPPHKPTNPSRTRRDRFAI